MTQEFQNALYKQVFSPEAMDFIAARLQEQKRPCESLREALEEYFGSHAVLVNSHTAALHLALLALDFKRGDKVICSVNNFVLGAQAARYFDAEPVFVDCGEDFNICPRALEAKINALNAAGKGKKLRALFLNHHSGNAAAVDEIKQICEKNGVQIINECGAAINLRVGGELLGAREEICCYSFSPVCAKPLFTAAFVLFKDPKIAARARVISNNALEGSASSDLGYFYDVKELGFDYALGDLNAAMAEYLLANSERFKARRKQLCAQYSTALAGLKHVKTPSFSDGSAYCDYIIRVDKNRDSFAKELAARDISSQIAYIPINLLAYYKQKYALKVTDFPNALAIYAQVLSLPLHSGLSDEATAQIAAEVARLDAKWI